LQENNIPLIRLINQDYPPDIYTNNYGIIRLFEVMCEIGDDNIVTSLDEISVEGGVTDICLEATERAGKSVRVLDEAT